MTDRSMMDYALAYARRGYAVFPCHPGSVDGKEKGKNPLVKHGFQLATTDEAQIRKWWSDWPNALIGCPPASKGMLVVDLDPVFGQEPKHVLAMLEDELGYELPEAPVVVTQSGGWHIWLRRIEGVELGNKKMAKGLVDIRCDNGYVILPPSRMANGNEYHWLDGADFEPPMMPEKLAEMVAKPKASPKPSQSVSSQRYSFQDDKGDEAVRKYARGALDNACAEMARLAKGGRGSALNSHAYSLGKLVGAGALTEREVTAGLQDAADACGLTATDGAQERDAKIRRGIEAGKAKCGEVQPRLNEIAQEARDREARRGPPPVSGPQDYGDVPDYGDGAEMAADTPDDGVEMAENDQSEDGAIEDEILNGLADIPLQYDREWMNRHFAFILVGSKGAILVEDEGAPAKDGYQLISVEAFHQLFSHRVVDVTKRGAPITSSAKWMADPDRRTYARGITFLPDPDGDISAPGVFNLWKGFSYQPKQGGSYGVLKDHILTNLSGGNQDYADYIFAWMAHMIQRPRDRVGVALVFRGNRGTGKTTLGMILGNLVNRNYFLVDDPRYVTGQFNSHLQSSLLLQADEAVWAGDKVAEGRLKGLITADIQFIERKGIDQIQVDNFVHLIMTSNEDWVVPAGPDERRYAVFDVGNLVAKNRTYFGELWNEMNNGGYEALLHDLLTFDLSTVDLNEVPKTKALLEQKLVSLDQISSWWFSRLHDGDTISTQSGWQEFIPKGRLMADYYLKANKSRPSSYKADEIAFGVKMRKLVSGIKESRRADYDEEGAQKRLRGFVFPSLADCRAAFEKYMEQEIVWPKIEKGDQKEAA